MQAPWAHLKADFSLAQLLCAWEPWSNTAAAIPCSGQELLTCHNPFLTNLLANAHLLIIFQVLSHL